MKRDPLTVLQAVILVLVVLGFSTLVWIFWFEHGAWTDAESYANKVSDRVLANRSTNSYGLTATNVVTVFRATNRYDLTLTNTLVTNRHQWDGAWKVSDILREMSNSVLNRKRQP